MTTSGIQGQRLEINVIGCRSLKDKEWLTRQDPYVVIEYANSKFRTRTDTDGGKNPSFNEKYTLPLIEGLREVNVQVWNSNSITYDDLIGTGRIQLEKALSTGYDDSTWSLISKSGKYAGEIRMILHYAHATAPPVNYAAPPPAAPHAGYHSAPQYATSAYSAYPSGYPPAHAPAGYPPAHSPAGYPPQVASHVYPPHPAVPYPPPAAPYQVPYPPSAYPPSSGPGYWPPSGAYPPYPGGHPGYPSY
ncbi:hypothetical protein O6H91_15G052100 [Diphasiastrum complanatum]|uniref:Uncharacterized protein n=2 Tax=Diphasiastrum complanatum TaxID=34168 RepID=A0ACC2BI91_DIPCM|nr:hypothetical protein O6H91_15G051200 [Diphasiastrum complanatum]KAJ7529474.1 hypothetical protein O6H91_15G052100 [Diphasiastrum complanatum]